MTNPTTPQTQTNTLFAVDAYEVSHFNQYPEAEELTSYLTFRKAMALMSISEKAKYRGWVDMEYPDDRIVWVGIRYIIETYISKKITQADITEARDFYATFNAGGTQYPFPEDLFQEIVDKFDGNMPLKIEALPEGSVVYPGTPVVQITAKKKFAPLVTWFEALIVQTWYPSTVATLSRRVRDMVEDGFHKSADADAYWKIPSRLHDFGFRGCTGTEQATIGGMAHLLSFEGTDTVPAAHYAARYLNNGVPVGNSIPAMAHCTVTPWDTEAEAYENMIDVNGGGAYAIVLDSYDFANAVERIIPSMKDRIIAKGGFLVMRPDSGTPKDMVLLGLRAAAAHFGHDFNKKGYKVLRGVGVIQGDGMSPRMILEVIDAVIEAGFSIENVAFGMGGGLLQKDLHRDILSAALKTNYIQFPGGRIKYVMKKPATDPTKTSLPGKLAVAITLDAAGKTIRQVFPVDEVPQESNELRVIYDTGPTNLLTADTFDEVRARLDIEWANTPKKGSAFSPEILDFQDEVAQSL